MSKKGDVVYKKIYKKINDEWFPTHLFWVKAGDIFKVEGDERSFMMVTDPIFNGNELPKIKYIMA